MKKEKGQILLITIMLVATILTVVLAVTFKSTTETQLTQLEEESQKALSAAEAGVEAVINQNIGSQVNIDTLPNIAGSGYSGQATVGSITRPTFVTPLLQKDQQYTFYLAEYPGFANPLNGKLTLYFMSEGACPSLELSFITASGDISRRLVDPCNNFQKPSDDLAASLGTYAIEGYAFTYHTDEFDVNNQVILLIRTLFAPTRIAVERFDPGNLPVQGKFVVSEAKSQSGVTKKVQLFQSYPQIPAEFFVTSF